MKSLKFLFLFSLICYKVISQDLIATEHPYLYLLNDETYTFKFDYKVNPNGYNLRVFNDSIFMLSNLNEQNKTYTIKFYKNKKLIGDYKSVPCEYVVKGKYYNHNIRISITNAQLIENFLFLSVSEYHSNNPIIFIKLNINTGEQTKVYLPQNKQLETGEKGYLFFRSISADVANKKMYIVFSQILGDTKASSLIEYSTTNDAYITYSVEWSNLIYASGGMLYYEDGKKVKCAEVGNLNKDFTLYSQGKYYTTKALLPYNNTIFFQSSNGEKYHYFKIADRESQKVNRSEAIPFNYTDMYDDKTQVGIFTDLESRAIVKQIKMPYESHIQLTDGYFQIVAINKKVKSKNKSILGADYEETKETTSKPSTVVQSFSQTCNVYRTFKAGEMRGDFKELKWQVKFISGRNTIDQYWEKDGFPTTSFKLNETFNVVESKKTEDYKYVYLINKTTAIFFNSKAPTTVTITTDGGKTFTEYATYDSYNKQFK